MKKFSIVLLAIISLNSFAQTEAPKLRIKEVKEYVSTINPDSTCLDEYLKRRKQLIIQLSATPVVAVAGTMASTYTGAVAAMGITAIANIDGWAGLGYVIGGATIGAVAGAGASVASATVSGVTLANNLLITKAVAEQYLDREGHYTDRLYEKYLKKSAVDLPRDKFLNKLIEADSNGKLCDGTMVKQPKIRIGTKLKYKVAKLKDLVRYMDQ